jgi:hypothetical protein
MSSEVPKSLHLNALNDCCAYHEQSGICPFLRARVTQRVTQKLVAPKVAHCIEKDDRNKTLERR